MESNLSGLSSLKEEVTPLYVQPHYKESYRLAIYALLCGGKEAYEEFLRAEQISHFLSDEEILFILENGELPVMEEEDEDESAVRRLTEENGARTSTYFPTESDEEVPDLDLGWPEVSLEGTDTSISLLFHPPRENTPSIKEVVRKQIQEARQVIAIAMDVFTDVDIFKEIINATLRGVAVYILLDDSQFKSFLTMSHRVGVNIHDFKNIRVRTVQGQQYQCQSGVKFHGALEEKFLLVDCRTVVYGTFSYTWTFEKINLSMVMVITGQLVCTFDEEFRRLYARSTIPELQPKSKLSLQYFRDMAAMHSPNSSQFALNQIHLRSRMMQGMRGAQDDRFNNAAMMTRGLSVQERLHQSHCLEMGNLVRGHSYGGELQRLNPMSRLRMGTKDFGGPLVPERTGPNMRVGGDLLMSNRLSQQHLKHRTLYGADQNLIPFNSETSLHRWKMDTYLNNSDLDASCEAISPLGSPYSSHTGLNEYQSQLIHNRSRDIKSRMEEMRQKRFSLQDYTNLRQSQECLRQGYPALDRHKLMTSLRGLDMRQSMIELEPNPQNGWSLEPTNQRDMELKKDGEKREQILTEDHRSASHGDVKMVPDRRQLQAYDWHEPLSRATSAADMDMKLNDPSLKLSHLQSSGLSLQHPRIMESLTKIPEEKESSNSRVNSSDSAFKEGNEEKSKEEKASLKENSVKSSVPPESQNQDQVRGSRDSIGKGPKSANPGTPKERKKSASNETQSITKNSSTSSGSQLTVDDKSTPSEKGPTQPEEQPLQRKNSMRMKVHSLLTPDEKKASKKEEKSSQRKASMKSQNPSGSHHSVRADPPQASPGERSTKKGHSPIVSRSQSSETEKHKSPFPRLSPQRSSKKKTAHAADQDRSERSTPDKEGPAVYQREKVYSRFEYLLSTESIPREKSLKMGGMHPSEKDRSSSLSRHDSGYPGYQSGTENKLGKFMQRVGNLINKNK
ncbi:LOW QUALITY PROTEIN: protein FAM83B-like [Xyrichtys novacula]|uniref:LOW QUALITY PROTEIN: protein FAM83B-like n=1 Tax=Xyrichtys novacula TaxID=13765 RepID=A0AAV1EYV2_XYRNO|nr:LOW QUALITY PROTEIN: protein FAM83B-like [Xyrichtys novacula]